MNLQLVRLSDEACPEQKTAPPVLAELLKKVEFVKILLAPAE